MTVQPKYHWQFQEREGTKTTDSVSGIQAGSFKAKLTGHGRIGNAVHNLEKPSHVNLGKEVGQFGTSDFTVAFGMKNISSHGDGELDIIGSQSMKGHGNFFSVRLTNRTIFFHVDENSKAKHYVKVHTERLPVLPKRTWFHIAAVREGRKIKIYIDGVLAAEAQSTTGVANIKNDTDVKLGHSRRGTPEAQYEDLRIYDKALSANEIQSLLPTTSPRLHAGEAELVAADGAAVVLNQDVDNLHRLSKQFQRLRLGPGTGATLYGGTNFESVSQKLYADIPDIRLSKLKKFPSSIRLFSAVGEPFTGGQIIETPNGQVKIADNEGQVGSLAPGEVALYENVAYHGKTWILSNSAKDGNKARADGNHTRFTDFQGLNDQVSSLRVGPDTGVTLFRNLDHQAADANREEEIEDIVKNVPDLKETQIGDDAASSLKIFNTIAPEGVFTSFSTKLSQDYRMVGDTLEEFSSYRTILRFEPGAGRVEVGATDLTEIEVEGTTYEIDEVRSVTLSPNGLNVIMITSEADGLNTPGLKLRTSQMAPGAQVVIFPNKEAHQQIAELEDGALWNATDAQGNLIVDRDAHSKEEVASVQNTIRRVMATVAYSDGAPIANTGKRVQSLNRSVAGDSIDNPWELKFGTVGESKISPSEWKQLRSQATDGEAVSSLDTGSQDTGGLVARRVSSRRIGKRIGRRIGRKFKKAIKKATSVVIGTVKNVVHVLVKTAKGIIDFVVDTAEKVADFVEAVVDKVVKGIKKFIEFLQFLFNWDDILKTQRYLVNAINAGFDYSAQLARAAKEPLSAFVDELQDTVESGINSLIESLGGDPSEIKSGDSGLPEAAEWFFSKLLGGSKQDGAKPMPDSKPNSALSSGASGLLEGFGDVVALILRGLEGLGETMTLLITNPLKPQLALIVMLETLRDVIIQALNIIESVALTFLDMVEGAIKQFQNLLNADINIPFITGLFKLIGAGDLTLLNLTGLLLAIPITVVHKIAFNERPFKDAAPLDFSSVDLSPFNVSSQPTLQLVGAISRREGVAIAQSRTAVAPAAILSESATEITTEQASRARESSIRGWGITALIADLVNGLSTALLDAITVIRPPSDDPFSDVFDIELPWLEAMTTVLDGVSWLASFPSSPGFPGGRPYNLLAHPVKRSQSEQMYRERVMWSWRTFVLGTDIVVSMRSPFERMKRDDLFTMAVFFLFSTVDVGLTAWYLESIPKEEKPGFEIANEVIGLMPNLFSPLLLINGHGPTALAIIDIAAAVVNTGLGGKLLADDLAEL